MKKEPIRVLSFGAGVQSTALFLKSCRGILPRLNYCVFADVGNEPKKVYDHLEWCKKEGEKHGIPVVVVKHTEDGLKDDVLKNLGKIDGKRVVSLPFFSAKKQGQVDGMVMRQCTGEYKIKPIIKFLRKEVLGLKKGQRVPKDAPKIQQWLGISFDEAPRAKSSLEKWKTHVFPYLCWGLDSPNGKVWRRYQIINWLEENYPQITVPRSACIICPFHSNAEWRKIQENAEEWEEACKFDEAIRKDKRSNKKLDSYLYLHRSGKPLREVDIRSDEEKGQGALWDNECEGMCGL